MNVRNCAKCGKIFQYVAGPPICPRCREKEEQDFQIVKEYIIENPKSNMIDVSNETGISARLIEKFIKDGRLMLSEDSPIFLKCEKCGAEIKTGRFCSGCSRNLSQAMRSSIENNQVKKEQPSPNKNKMHFLNKER